MEPAKYNGKHPGGRPRTKNTSTRTAELVIKFADYIEKTKIPILCEFAYQNDITRDDMYDNPEFSALLKKCINKKQASLEKEALADKVNVAMAIFSLKQLGWRDKQDIDHTTKGDKINFSMDKLIEAIKKD